MKIKDVVIHVKDFVSFDFYANKFPRNAEDNCGFIRLEGGGDPHLYIPGFKSSGIQIVIRHKDAQEAERIANEVWAMFHGKTHYMIGDTKVFVSMCDQSEPIGLGEDKNERIIFSVNVSCRIVE